MRSAICLEVATDEALQKYKKRRTKSRKECMPMRAYLLVLLLLFPACGSAAKSLHSVRPITVKVIDAKTKEPLKGVSVYYALQTIVFQKYIFLIIPNLEPDIGPKIAHKEHKYTDERGKAVFFVDDFRLPNNERLEEEFMFINLDVDMKSSKAISWKETLESSHSSGRARREGPVDNIDVMEKMVWEDQAVRNQNLVLPDPKYRGIYLISHRYGPNEGFRDWTKAGDKFNVRHNFSSLSKDSDLVVIELE